MVCEFKDLKCNISDSGVEYGGLVIWVGILFGIIAFLYLLFALINLSGKCSNVCFCICRPRNESILANCIGFFILLCLIIA